MSGTWRIRADLLPLPARTGRAVFEDYPTRLEVRPDPIGGGKIARTPRVAARLDQRLDLFGRQRWLRVLGTPERHHAEHEVERVESLPNQSCVRRAHSAGIHGGVHVPYEFEHHALRS